MRYNAIKARNLLLWMVHEMEFPSLPMIWPLVYIAERKYLAITGTFILGDTYAAMQEGPVPLRMYTEFHTKIRESAKTYCAAQLDEWLMRVALSVNHLDLQRHFTFTERECILWAINDNAGIGLQELRKHVKDLAWECAGPDGLLDPLEIAKQGGASAAALDFVKRWREWPYLMEAPTPVQEQLQKMEF